MLVGIVKCVKNFVDVTLIIVILLTGLAFNPNLATQKKL